ncbi:hypothetical protein HFO43_17610 [Rhizobium leguminosarum]|uniref:hypothetical protein n=1 Tax=Rhizobium TaxID=379 RepID=UPI001C9082CC|nr:MULTISPECIES: hypothetical protein [Rhizobium]MBY3053357.1 hypothetical protein [Rhizobium laguerreae]MBY5610652.1 hypothetical protein [Rhizobium leguminosarum]MBY5655555.1 hypothetical protein [Rhizobium leguminosarum]MBY5670338.1 hypothetical protein [Rhizobium leguminosarum]
MVADSTTRFPFINLEKALSRAGELYAADRAGRPMPVATAFEIWGYSPKSSGAFQTVGALRGYGLIENEGANETRTVKLTGKARNYFLDERDDQRRSLLTTFALSPPLFRSLWEDSSWQLGIPADPIARSHLKIERRLNEQSARSLLSIFRDNIQFAGLQSSDSAGDEGYSDEVGAPDSDEAPAFKAALQGGRPISNPASIQREAKPIVFDMETVSGQYQFDNAEDLTDFISKLEKIKALLPAKKITSD